MRKTGIEEKTGAWDTDHAILDRLDEHRRFKRDGVMPEDICLLQHVSPSTYAEDELRLLELDRRRVEEASQDWRFTLSLGYLDTIAQADEIIENWSRPTGQQLAAIQKKLQALKALARLHGLYQ